MDIIDQSGVLESTDGTATEKVEALIEKVQSGGGDNGELRGLIEDTLKEFSNNEITTVRRYAFVQTQILEKVDLPNVVTVGAGAFSSAPRLKEVNLPLTTSCGISCFNGCAELLKYNLPKLQVLSDNMFSECVKLKIHDLHSCTSIGSAAFQANLSLTAVTLRNNSVVALSHILAFGRCPHYLGIVDATYNPEGLKDGYIYVPRKLISSYQTATNWSSLYAIHENMFRALEDYTVDGTITGALDESKI